MRGEIIVLFLMLSICSVSAHNAVLSGWEHFTPELVEINQMHLSIECIDEKLRGEDSSSWCEHKTNYGSFTVEYKATGFQGDWIEVTGIRVGCSGTGSGYQNGVWGWNYGSGSWSDELGSCGSEGENYWDLSADYFQKQSKKVKLICDAAGGAAGAGNTAELFVDKIYYKYNTFPTATPEILPNPSFAHSNLSLDKNFFDADDDLEENSSINWVVNNETVAQNKSNLEHSLEIGDLVHVEYTPCDSYGQCGETKTFQTTIENHPTLLKEKNAPEKTKGGEEVLFGFEAEDPDGQEVSLACSLDDPNVSSNECELESKGDKFNCSMVVPQDTSNHTLNCYFHDGLNKTFFEHEFQTDLTPPIKGVLEIENNNGFTNKENPAMEMTSDASFMRFACSEEKLNESEWIAFSETTEASITKNPGCDGTEGNKTFFVEFSDEVGNIQEEHANASVFLDLSPPVTNDSSEEGIHLPGYLVTITEQDAHDTNITTKYCKDLNGTCTPEIKNNTIIFNTRGKNHLRYISFDSAGNEIFVDKIIRINILPGVQAKITPEDANARDVLSCDLHNITNEVNQSISANYSWFKNGILVGKNKTLENNFKKKDNITCVLEPFDGLEKGQSTNSTLQVSNAPPEVDMRIVETNSITCEYNVTDPDEEELEIEQLWLKNGEYYCNRTLIEDEEMGPGDVFTCKVTSTDGESIVEVKETYSIPVINKPKTSSSGGGGGSSGGGIVAPIVPTVIEKEGSTTEQTDFEEEPPEQNETIPEVKEEQNITEELVPEPLERPIPMNKSKATMLSSNSHEPVLIGIVVLLFVIIFSVLVNKTRLPEKTKKGTKTPGYEKIKKRWSSFPSENKKELTESIAKTMQEKHGSFHGAGVYKTMERLYGDEVSKKRITIEKEVNEILKSNPTIEFKEQVGRKKLYKFKDS